MCLQSFWMTSSISAMEATRRHVLVNSNSFKRRSLFTGTKLHVNSPAPFMLYIVDVDKSNTTLRLVPLPKDDCI